MRKKRLSYSCGTRILLIVQESENSDFEGNSEREK